MVGRTVAHYKVVERIGSGGMGIVYKAEDLRLGRPVALKFLPPEMSSSPTAVERFQREARTASALNHPNICTIYAIDEFEGQRFLAMELLEGQPLNEVINGKPMATGFLLDLGVQIADALDAAHSQGILHRDIKPANIFVTRKNRVKVLDFGLAKLALLSRDSSDSNPTMAEVLLTTEGVALGTVAYMSPEQARGDTLDARSDIFSFGIVLYEMATGQQAFPGRTSAVVFDAILNRTPPAVSLVHSEVPAIIERIISRALDKDLSRRYQTIADLRADLQRVQRERETASHLVASGSRPAANVEEDDDEETPTLMLSASDIVKPRTDRVMPSAPAVPPLPPPTTPVPRSGPNAAAPPLSDSGPGVAWTSFAPPPRLTPPPPSGPSSVRPATPPPPPRTPPPPPPAAATMAAASKVPPPAPPKNKPPAAKQPGKPSNAANIAVAAIILVFLAVGLGALALFFFQRAPEAPPTTASTPTPPPPVQAPPPEPPPPAPVDAPATPTPGDASATAVGAPAPAVPPPTPATPSVSTPAAGGTAAPNASTQGKAPKKPAATSTKKPADEPPAGNAIVPVVPKESPLKPDPGELLLGAARGKADARLYDQALTDLQTIVHDHATSTAAPGAYLLMAKVQAQQGRSDDAIASATALRAKFPASGSTAEGSVLLGQWIERSRQENRVVVARGILADVPVKFPDSPWAPRALAAKALLETRERVKETDPTFGSVPAQFLTNREIAEKYATSPEAELAFWQVGEEYDSRKRYDLAAKAFADLGTHFPETRYDAWWRAAELYDKRLKDRAAAQAAYAKVPSSSRNFKDAQKRATGQ